MKQFRKYLEPEYGEKGKEVILPEPENIDLNDAARWRAKHNPITAKAIYEAVSTCECYDEIMKVYTDNAYLTRDDAVIPIRVYYPAQEGSFPVVVFCHGGGFMMNDFSIYDYVTRYLSRYGQAVVIAMEYRLAPEFPFPTGLEDAYAVLEWAVSNAKNYGGDISSLTVCGDSSGGNFAAVLPFMARDRKGPVINKQILIYPLVTFTTEQPFESEIRYGTGYFLEYKTENEPLKAYFRTDDWEKMKNSPYCSPLLAEDFSGIPDACILNAECDPLLDQGLMYAARLEDAGISVEFHMYKGMIHSFLNYAYRQTFECLDAMCNAIPKIKK